MTTDQGQEDSLLGAVLALDGCSPNLMQDVARQTLLLVQQLVMSDSIAPAVAKYCLDEDGEFCALKTSVSLRAFAQELMSQPIEASGLECDEVGEAEWQELEQDARERHEARRECEEVVKELWRSGILACRAPVIGVIARATYRFHKLFIEVIDAIDARDARKVYDAIKLFPALACDLADFIAENQMILDTLARKERKVAAKRARQSRVGKRKAIREKAIRLYRQGRYQNPHQAKHAVCEAIFEEARQARVLASRERAVNTVYLWLLEADRTDSHEA